MRVFLIVLDSLGAGALPDAPIFGDEGAFTLRSLSQSPKLHIPNLVSLGIGDIDGLSFLGRNPRPAAAVGKCVERSAGKDTTVGHWEIAGLISERAFPTYPNGFPPEIISAFEDATGRGTLVNATYSGTEVINDFGDEHVRTGKYIVYTSADSVFQIAAHEDVIPLSELYDACEKARAILVGENGVGRVIARPFIGESGHYVRTGNRRDFSIAPPALTMLDLISDTGFDVISIGKIDDIFAGQGITKRYHTENNAEGMETLLRVAGQFFEGLCFVNLVDFDMVYGHRRDVDGYAQALSDFDRFLKLLWTRIDNDDVVVITADHGCDPAFRGTDHTREYVPLLVAGPRITPTDLGVRATYADISASILDLFRIENPFSGISFVPRILESRRA